MRADLEENDAVRVKMKVEEEEEVADVAEVDEEVVQVLFMVGLHREKKTIPACKCQFRSSPAPPSNPFSEASARGSPLLL